MQTWLNEHDLSTLYSPSMRAAQPAGLRSVLIFVSVCLTVKISMHKKASVSSGTFPTKFFSTNWFS